MTASFAGKVVAIAGPGGPIVRAIAVAFAEAGADIALGTQSKTQEQEFAMASIANEVWVLGNEQFLRVMESSEEGDAAAFAEATWGELQACHVLVAAVPDPGPLVRAFAGRLASVECSTIVLVATDPEQAEALWPMQVELSKRLPVGAWMEGVTVLAPEDAHLVLEAATR